MRGRESSSEREQRAKEENRVVALLDFFFICSHFLQCFASLIVTPRMASVMQATFVCARMRAEKELTALEVG